MLNKDWGRCVAKKGFCDAIAKHAAQTGESPAFAQEACRKVLEAHYQVLAGACWWHMACRTCLATPPFALTSFASRNIRCLRDTRLCWRPVLHPGTVPWQFLGARRSSNSKRGQVNSFGALMHTCRINERGIGSAVSTTALNFIFMVANKESEADETKTSEEAAMAALENDANLDNALMRFGTQRPKCYCCACLVQTYDVVLDRVSGSHCTRCVGEIPGAFAVL